MCGIAGIFDLRGRPIADSEVRAMNDLIRHRGPDDGGQYVEQGLGLAKTLELPFSGLKLAGVHAAPRSVMLGRIAQVQHFVEHYIFERE